MRIQNNITANNTHRYYNIANNNVANSAEKLSSGYRINRAGDDAAGLAISEKMRAQIRGLEMASKNSSDAISLIQTAEGALQSTHDILQKMRTLAVQSASDSNEQTIDRAALNQEFQALKTEVDEIASKTRFNDQNLIDGTFQKSTTYKSDGTFAAGATTGNVMSILVDRAVGGTYTVSVTVNAPTDAQAIAGATATVATDDTKSTALTFTATGDTFGTTNDFGEATAATFTGAQTSNHNGNVYTFKVEGADASNLTISLIGTEGVVSKIQNFNGVGSGTFTLNFEGVGSFSFVAGASANITDSAAGASAWQGLLNGKKLEFEHNGVTPGVDPAVAGYIELDIAGDKVSLYHGDTSATFKTAGIQLSFNAITDYDLTGAANAKFAAGTIVVSELQGQSMIIQAGANQGDEFSINIDAMNTRKLGIAFSDVATQKHASKAITEVNDAINQVSTQRAALGAMQNRLSFKQANLDTSAENLQAAEARIRDVDMAKEMTAFSKKNILTQAATAMLAQANSMPQNVLQLLR